MNKQRNAYTVHYNERVNVAERFNLRWWMRKEQEVDCPKYEQTLWGKKESGMYEKLEEVGCGWSSMRRRGSVR